ncbi:hypothetical protein [Gemmatimonas sp.]|uniref:hypothetical protein n=1 Tax=Gemmatimonas sp. TaxID=1962908 RepID=UPI003983CD6E
MARVLGHAIGRDATDPAVEVHVLTIRGMVEADSTEVHVSGYLRTVWTTEGHAELEPTARRTLAIALWHIAKAGLVRDAMAREIASLRCASPAGRPLGDQLRDAILGAPPDASTRAPFVPPRPHEASAQRRR